MGFFYFFSVDSIDLYLYGGAVLFLSLAQVAQGCLGQDDSEGVSHPLCSVLPMFGSILITCSWLHLSSYLTQLPIEIGIFVVMFREIFKTIAKLGLLLLIFIIAFGLGFHIMLNDQVKLDLSMMKLI